MSALTVTGSTGSVKTTSTTASGETSVARCAGVTETTSGTTVSGASPVVKPDTKAWASALPAVSVTAGVTVTW